MINSRRRGTNKEMSSDIQISSSVEHLIITKIIGDCKYLRLDGIAKGGRTETKGMELQD